MTQEEIKELLKRAAYKGWVAAAYHFDFADYWNNDGELDCNSLIDEPPLPAETLEPETLSIEQFEKMILKVMNVRKASDETFMLQPYHGGWLIHIYNAETNLHRKTVGSHDLKSAIEKLDYLPNNDQKAQERDATGDAKRTES